MDYTNMPYQQPQQSYPIIHHGDTGILNTVLLNQQTMMANQAKMMQTLVELETRMENLAEVMKGCNPTPPSPQKDVLTPEIVMELPQSPQMMVISPVNSLQELNDLERRLQDEKVMRSYLSGMSYICGTSGKARSLDCCNKLIDYFITPEFLHQCSWVGALESSLKFYKNFRSLFSRLIMQADKDFTEMKCDKFFKTLLKVNQEQDALVPMAAASSSLDVTEQRQPCVISPVTCLEDLVALENRLQDERVMNNYIKDMSFICGTSGKARALNCCYKLVDYFVTREFLMQCSWTGACRTSEGGDPLHEEPGTAEQIPFKFYRRFRILFLRLILQADKDFSELQCDKFFKTILKNRKQRLQAKVVPTMPAVIPLAIPMLPFPLPPSQDSIIKPVNSVEELDALEQKLHDEAQMMKYINGMSFICGTSDKVRATDCCYKLIDYFVTRDFLIQCSWTGGARTPDGNETAVESEKKKIPMKFYTKVRSLFTSLVLLVDRDFSEFQCEKFFKTILKNAKQRLNAKTMTSRQKNRPCNLKYTKRIKKDAHEVYIEEHEQESSQGGEETSQGIKNEIFIESYENHMFH